MGIAVANSEVQAATDNAIIPPIKKDIIAANPACPPASPGKTNIPAPSIAPKPIDVAEVNPSVRFNLAVSKSKMVSNFHLVASNDQHKCRFLVER